jgi:acetyl-CoA C-acetyltransferase
MGLMSERAVIVGVGQLRRRPGLDFPDTDWEAQEPTRIVADARRLAAAAAGRPTLIEEADAIGWVPAISWGYEDAAGSLAQALGRPPAKTGWSCAPGGDGGVQVLNDAANRIAEGEIRIALLGGCEVLYSRRRARKEGIDLDQRWTPGGSQLRFVDPSAMRFSNELERRHHVTAPVSAYPFLENALRAAAGRSIDEHQAFLGRLYARFSDVASVRPHSWFPDPRSADDIARVTAKNRWVGFPYPKNMNAIMEVDQAAALVVMAASEADRLGIPPERRATYLGGGRSVDGWSVSERAFLDRSPAYAAAAAETMRHAAIEAKDVDLFDLYSCFPAVVEFAMQVLGLAEDDPRGFTQTGGLAQHGGPGNAYSLHGLANVALALRERPNAVGWVSALGMTATKHAVCAISNDPARVAVSDGRASVIELAPAEKDGPPLVDDPSGAAVVESYTVLFDRANQPQQSIFMLRLGDRRRTLALGGAEPEVIERVTRHEGVGLRGTVAPGEGDAPNRFVLGLD